MKPDFPNELEKVVIDIPLPKPVITIEEKHKISEKRLAKTNIIVFSVLFSAISIFMAVCERPVISETENRTLAKFPEYSKESLLKGTYTDGISEFYNDTVPYRNVFKDIAATIKSYAGIEMNGIKVYTVNSNPSVNTSKPAESSVSAPQQEAIVSRAPEIEEIIETTTPAPIPEDDITDAGELSNNIMIYKNRGIPIYYGSFAAGEQYASIVNRYKEALGDAVNVYSMVCPTAISFYWPASSDISHGSESENLENIKNYLVNVKDVNTIETLYAHRSEHIYSRTDHHWQPLGAYYAAELFAKIADVPFDNLSNYEEVIVPDYVGTLYGYSGAAEIKDNPEDFVFYRPDNKYTTHYYSTSFEYWYDGELLVEAYGSALYCTFMGGDEKIVHIETDAPNDRTLFIIKDSYGNALVPFLTNSFKNIYVIDMRYFDLNIISFMQEHGVTDLLFAMNTFSATGSNYLNLETLLYQ